ncbi:hypothetical protein E1B28_005182 [Marasmius oreades]|uniref:ABC transporter domain-containing protein n=1 Tax=Marasmius oreades TaxID=181124 RepID=A0A9P7V030_9AGAR|nr:uncharacterized protein E1B28_005182 [Marasmius oreades]KAG7097870.1 hypothetical protein E1B28_005182 [Marasmius oreades]
MGKPTIAAIVSPSDSKTKFKPESQETEVLNLGVFQVIVEKRSSFRDALTLVKLHEVTEHWIKSYQTLKHLLSEVLAIQPFLVIVLLGLKMWHEMHLKTGSVDTRAVLNTLMTRIFFVILGSYIGERCRELEPGLKAQIINHYETILMNTKLSMDLPSLQENIKFDQITACLPWNTIETIVEVFAKVAALVGQLGFVLSFVRSGNHGLMYTMACLANPVMTMVLKDNLWSRPRVVRTTNEDYNRMSALGSLTEKTYRHEVISGNLVQFILSEYRKARAALGKISTDYPETQYYKLNSSFKKEALKELAEDLPMLYNVCVVLLRPGQMSLTMMATLQQSSSLLRWSFYLIHHELETFARRISDMQQFYDLQRTMTIVKDGAKSYPNENESSKGMAFELNNVAFSYPSDVDEDKVEGKDSSNSEKRPALDGVSFRIGAGELVVVVGANGSGKSTFINLLTRMYDVSSGEILVDGDDIRTLKLSDFRQATATLTQDHSLLPLSIAENIGLGDPENARDRGKILEAARKGGCEKIVEKLDSGLDTVLDPAGIQYHWLVDESKKDTELAKEVKKLRKSSNVSGGERQRLVAARTFMRFNSNKIKFVAVDEPSSALDPSGEVELFDHLREARAGKTMLFVTHRFGPITKYADQIICMKEGKVYEHGTHEQLMVKQGEYYKMYNVQAKAFEKTKAESAEVIESEKD